MARIKLDIPENLPFRTQLEIRVTDLNYGNHLGNDRVLSMMHEARMRFLASKGMNEIDAAGVSFIMGDCAIVYKSEGHYGQKMEVHVGAGDYARVSFDIFYRFVLADDEKVIAEGKTGIVCYDYKEGKVKAVPQELKEALGDLSAMELQKGNSEA